MRARKLGVAILVLVGIITASFVIAETKDGLNVGNADAAPMGGNTLYVGGSGPNNYTKIQDAIDNANDGDTVFVYNGTYYENIIINKTINLIGENKNTTIIDGGLGLVDTVNITENRVGIRGFTITHSKNLPNAGIKINYANNVTISNCNISNNDHYGILLENSSINTISNCNISNNDHYGILLENSSINTISNCNISNNFDDGISAWYSSSNKISNCNIYTNDEAGISNWRSSNNTISNCNIFKNGNSIWLGSSSNVTISNCDISNNDYGIFVSSSSNNTIYTSNIYSNNYAIRLDSSPNNTIYNCNIYSNNWAGILLDSSSNNSIYSCNFTDDGIEIEGDVLSHFIYNNTVNGKPLLYYKNKNNVILDGIGVGQIILANCSNFEIKNISISHATIGIEIAYSNDISLANCNISNNGEGIRFHSSFNNTISNCNISNNGVGTDADSFYNNTISNCNISNNGEGIRFHSSFNNTISNCNIYSSSSWHGILFDSSSYNTLFNCNICSSNWYNVYLYSSSNNTISNCNISKNRYGGILFDSSSSNNIISNCNISDNNHHGIRFHSSSNNTIYTNNFINNSNTVYCLYNSTNIWHSPMQVTYTYDGNTYTSYLGNYWSNYTGSDANHDGIGDVAYYIEENNYDYYPLMMLWENYMEVLPTGPVHNLNQDTYYDTIQQAIDNASNGDTIYVYNGTYYENVVVDKSINLVGEDRNTTIIDGGGKGNVITISVDWANISAFKIRNSGTDEEEIDSGLFFNSSSYSNISYCIMMDNLVGIHLHSSHNNTIYHCDISNNTIGVLLLAYSEIFASNDNSVVGNTITNNHVGIELYKFNENNIISNNLILDCYDGLNILLCDNNSIIKNNISKNENGIKLQLWGLCISQFP